MKRRIPSAGRTGRRSGESGSITLEAALLLPIVLMVVIFFIGLIRLNTVQMALHSAVSQTVRQAAANIHPVDLALQKLSASVGAAQESGPAESAATDPQAEAGAATGAETEAGAKAVLPAVLEQLPGVDVIAEKLEEWLPAPAGPLLSSALQGDWKPVADAAATEAGRGIIEPLLRQEADKSVLDPEELRLSKLSLPDLKNKTEVSLLIEAEYEFKLGFPFTKKSIVLRERAEERVWVRDSISAPQDQESAQSDEAPIQIVLLEPSPANPGRRARVVVKTSPGRKLSIQIIYKSGHSVAKHLGDTYTDNDGFAEWTWLISGNTTPGVWELIVTASEGSSRAARHFVVEKRTAQ
ncbi:TadE/TadG family type IV pilus assembly protein [Paenibacillus lignilyticus]|uniref:Pilus assembly protein n=1 Tax=Paenibacillus lignilyticus TaxID=1172615 RepID=A0ABS5CIS9_9BACL|nr:TadE family protein [Paenibacillus lignilyticus]MBP3965780.1 pilus assembly protein [Paenibacillus lignilyticus]